MSKELTDALMLDLRRSPRAIAAANCLRIMPNARFSPGAQNYRYVDVRLEPVQQKYELYFDINPFYQYGQTVQYLPWATNSGIYISLRTSNPVFFTDKLSGCFLAFDFETPYPTISHLNFIDYSEQEKRQTLESYSDRYVLCPEDYRGYTTVFGVFGGRWEFFYQVENVHGGMLLMSDARNRYGTKSVLLK